MHVNRSRTLKPSGRQHTLIYPEFYRLASPSEQLAPPSAAVFPGGLCLPQLAVEWNNHAVTPREQKGSTPVVLFGGVLVKQRLPAANFQSTLRRAHYVGQF
ncbi:hypothetical protein EYF80_014268 [Liparis tanakae]|uniref:Uncharacterized protein n=1 Tax=Liparis tanakae TaxID=230148 RepID=A0A4Z2IBT5_9TELE|nr:hypothetical protein EYF80_014268 [Liparis tanakae]